MVLPLIRIRSTSTFKYETGYSCGSLVKVSISPICRYQTEPMLMDSDQLQLVKEMT